MWMVGMGGILVCILAFCLGFIPPRQVGITDVFVYELLLVGGIAVATVFPFLLKQR